MTTPISLTAIGTAYTQNFDTLSNVAGSTTNALSITGWEMTEAGGGARDNDQYAVDNGTSNTGDTYSYGAAGSTERALGSLQSGTLIPTFGAVFVNDTGSTITSLDVSYTGEEWRFGQASRGADRLDFQYSLDATDLNTGTWVDANALDFSTPNTSVTVGATDGSAAAFRTAISSTITGLNIAPGATFFIRWSDAGVAGADDGLAVDDFSLTPHASAASPLLVTTLSDVVDAGDGLTSLREAIIYANSNPGADTITFATGLAGGTIRLDNVAGSLLVSDTLTINGDVDGDNIPDITITGDVAGNDVTLAGGVTDVFNTPGGDLADNIEIIYSTGAAKLTMNGVVLTGGVGGGGGAINASADVEITHSIISGNQSGVNGGAIAALGTATLTNMTLSNNRSTSNSGGGVFADIVNLTDSVVSGNSADSGGGISAVTAATLLRTTVIGNHAGSGGGGGLYVFDAPPNGVATITDSTLSGNDTTGAGGAVFAQSVVLKNVTVAGNQAAIGGGGVYANTDATITNSTITGNDGGSEGGGVDVVTGTLTNSIVMGNTATTGADTFAVNGPYVLNGRNIVGTDVFDGSTDIGDTSLSDVFAGPLANNGGPVATFALNPSRLNPAIDAGDDGLAPAADARGFARVAIAGAAHNGANISDLGAYELQSVLNAAPTDIILSQSSVAENSANGTVVGALSDIDPDAGDAATFTLTDNAGGRFAISGSNLVVANGALLDYESSTSHSVTVRATDLGGLTFDKIFSIAVTDVAEGGGGGGGGGSGGVRPFQWLGSVDLGVHGGGYQVAGAGDFNHDGTADVLWRNPTTGAVDEWTMQNGNWSKSTSLGARSPDTKIAAIGDFNGDGTSDVLWRDASGHLDVWIMANGQWSKSVDLGSRDPVWKVLGTGDFDGDGTSDILFQNSTTGAVDSWKMQNGNWSASQSLGSFNTAWSFAGIGDFNHDGTSDVLWRNPTTGQVEEWQMAKGNWAASISLGSFNAAYTQAVVNDFNGDGTADVLWRNPTTGKVEGWVMQNGQWSASVPLGSFDPAYQLAATGDFNRAGGAEVLWHNATTGQTGSWLLG
jgi:predicted outer membrane repeat protein